MLVGRSARVGGGRPERARLSADVSSERRALSSIQKYFLLVETYVSPKIDNLCILL